MKTLYLVRHAKSSWKYPRLNDFERPLNKRGRNNSPFIGSVLNLGVEEREEGTAAAISLAINNGAHIVRIHDVKKMKRVVTMVDAILATN